MIRIRVNKLNLENQEELLTTKIINMDVTRVIVVYDKLTEEFVKEINVDFIEFEYLKDIFKPSEDDPSLYKPYDIFSDKSEKLKNHIDLSFDFSNYTYELSCYQAR